MKYTCQGADVNPELRIEEIPEKTACFALIMDDPDAPRKTWDHWVVWNIPATMTTIPENVTFSPPVMVGKNSWGHNKYGGPCPPSGVHRYYFRLFALDQELELPSSATKEDLKKAMKKHILAKCEYMGTYQRQ